MPDYTFSDLGLVLSTDQVQPSGDPGDVTCWGSEQCHRGRA